MTRGPSPLRLLELEVTGRCQLECVHCYASSGPLGTHGDMLTSDWLAVIDQAAAMGVEEVQFIGGEPTLHPDLPVLVRHALGRGLEVEVYSNLVRVTPQMWDLFSLPGVRLATSYYSDDAEAHNAVTGRRSHHRTLANIEKAHVLGVPLRVGMVDIAPDAGQAAQTMRSMGAERVQVDHLRQIGRGVRDRSQGVDELCGMCGDGRVAVLPSGHIAPCVVSRWIDLGDVRSRGLAAALEGPNAAQVRGELSDAFRGRDGSCGPDGNCTPPQGGCTPPLQHCRCQPQG